MRKHLWVVRNKKAPAFFKEGYKQSKNKIVVGRSKTGEISPKGLVAHTEDWDGRVAADVAPGGVHYIKEGDSFRPMTFVELVERGYFIIGTGPKGVRKL